MKNRPFRERLGFAFAGITAGWRRERSFRTHVACGALVLLALVLLRPAPVWWAIIALIVGLILAFELFNAALESLIDHIHPDQHPEIGTVKDMAAGAVLVLSAVALLIAAALLVSLL